MSKHCMICGKQLGPDDGKAIPDYDLDSDRAHHVCDQWYPQYEKSLINIKVYIDSIR